MLLMGSYIVVRFAPRFWPGAVALIHDRLVVTGALTLTQITCDLTVLATIIIVVEYSVHDTIIVPDCICVNLQTLRRVTLAMVINGNGQHGGDYSCICR